MLAAIDLDGKRNQLDAQASEIADNKDASVVSRKKLAEQTKGNSHLGGEILTRIL
jgi:hypothetical protein